MSLEIRKLNQLRRTCTSHWKDESDMPRPIVTMSKDPEGCDDMMNAFRTIASEMGLRHVHLCLVDNLTAEHQEMLTRKGPRLVTITDIDGVPEDDRPGLHEKIAAGARTLVACLIHAPEEEIPTLANAWRTLQEAR